MAARLADDTSSGWRPAPADSDNVEDSHVRTPKSGRKSGYATMLVLLCALIIAGALLARAIPDDKAHAATELPLSSAAMKPTKPGNFKCSATGSEATRKIRVTGAPADGSADSSEIIQRAIDTAGRDGGGIVSLPAGTFMVNSHLVLMNNVKLTGVGQETVIKAGPRFLSETGPGGGYPIVSTAGADNATIANLTADQSGNTLDANVSTRLFSYAVEGRDSTNVLIRNVHVVNPFTYSIAMVATSDFCVIASNVNTSGTIRKYDQLDGVHILDSHHGDVIDNVIKSGDDGLAAHSLGGPVHNVFFGGNVVDGGPGASGLQFAVNGTYPIYDIKVKDNQFYGSPIGIHTGYYGSNPTGSVHNVQISNNQIFNLLYGAQGPAVEMTDALAPGKIRNVIVDNTTVCNAGNVSVQPRPGNSVTGTKACGTTAANG
jgi:polygalacturonase